MDVLYSVCCGLDIHKRMISGCILAGREKEQRLFGTTTNDLLELADWI
jgi:hypothetical protein